VAASPSSAGTAIPGWPVVEGPVLDDGERGCCPSPWFSVFIGARCGISPAAVHLVVDVVRHCSSSGTLLQAWRDVPCNSGHSSRPETPSSCVPSSLFPIPSCDVGADGSRVSRVSRGGTKRGPTTGSNHGSLLLVYLEPNPECGCGGQARGIQVRAPRRQQIEEATSDGALALARLHGLLEERPTVFPPPRPSPCG
jgi:hypothetical protein